MSSLNITIENKMTISYIHGINTAATVPPVRRYETGSSELSQKPNAGQALVYPHGHQIHNPQVTSAGSCSVLMEAPPGKVLTLLFLNQTCSRDNYVRVRDIHNGWSTTLDGCSPWMSPGYDVMTSNRSAVVVISLHNTTDFFRLQVQVKAVSAQATGGMFTHYVSPTLGYIQTPAWHPFTRPVRGATSGTAGVTVPLNHITLISVTYSHHIFPEQRKQKRIPSALFTISNGTDEPRREWEINELNRETPEKVMLPQLTEFRLVLRNVHDCFFSGIRVLFSFHKPLSAPRKNPDGLWNCSVPFWSDFHQHIVCNHRTECSGREDEMWCPDTSCQGGDKNTEGILSDERCYFFLKLPFRKTSWHFAASACKQKGATLASFPTVMSWYYLVVLTRAKEPRDIIFIGLHSPDASYPHMYRYSVQWYNASIGQFVNMEYTDPPPVCYHVQLSTVFPTFCSRRVPRSPFALCQTSLSSSLAHASQKKRGKEKDLQAPTEQKRSQYRNAFPVPNIPCPDHHVTLDFLACDAFSACWRDSDVQLREPDTTTDVGQARACVDVHETSFKALFRCQNVPNSVPYSLVCDHLQDCADNSDEDFCVFPDCSAALQYKCANGQCLRLRQRCDDFKQCVDGSDETDCVSRRLHIADSVVLPRPPVVGDFDGRGWMTYTEVTAWRGKDALTCSDTHVFCPGDGYCLPVYTRCNGLNDCPGQEDEVGCESYTCPGFYRCRGMRGTCLHPDHVCDGWPQCPQLDDELFCNLTCPVNCTCLGHAFACSSDFHVELFSRLRYLDAGGTGLEPERLSKNHLLVYLSLARCELVHLGCLTLPNLLSLNLSDNRLSGVTVAELNMMTKLQHLFLARNPLSKLFPVNQSSGFLVHKNIIQIDLTGVDLKGLAMPSDLPFPNLLSLNLSHSGLTHLSGDGYRSLTSLRTIDLRGSPMALFPRRLFDGLKDLRLVFTDNYKLCCEANLPDGFNVANCHAPFNEISSCDALLLADVYRVCLSVLAALALCGNSGSFCLRIFSLTGRGKTGFTVFVAHLCVSDFVMGVYMAMVGVADRMYLGRYLWEEDKWRHGAACQLAGVLALLSSEVSAFIICLITLDRYLVIRFPFSRFRFSPFSAEVASILTWVVGIVLVIVPLLPFMDYGSFYGQTGICIPLPVTRNDFAGHNYAFGVMILLNLVVFLVIATGQISVYMSMTNNAMSSFDTTRKSRDLIVARRLITVVVSDFLCWFPVGLLGVLATQGVPVPGEVNVAMAIFVLPLNSALNPFLYTLNIIQEKRQRAKEVELLKMIMNLGIKDVKQEEGRVVDSN